MKFELWASQAKKPKLKVSETDAKVHAQMRYHSTYNVWYTCYMNSFLRQDMNNEHEIVYLSYFMFWSLTVMEFWLNSSPKYMYMYVQCTCKMYIKTVSNS